MLLTPNSVFHVLFPFNQIVVAIVGSLEVLWFQIEGEALAQVFVYVRLLFRNLVHVKPKTALSRADKRFS